VQVVPDLFVVAVVLHFRIVEAFGERGMALAYQQNFYLLTAVTTTSRYCGSIF